QYEIRDKSDDLIAVIAKGKGSYIPTFTTTRTIIHGTFNVPARSTASAYILRVTITDKVADATGHGKTRLKISEPASPFPISVRFAVDPEGKIPASGR